MYHPVASPGLCGQPRSVDDYLTAADCGGYGDRSSVSIAISVAQILGSILPGVVKRLIA